MAMQNTKQITCPACKGIGTRRDPKTMHGLKCERCDGAGHITVPDDSAA
jgi:DnaJ-class molecular chaperone